MKILIVDSYLQIIERLKEIIISESTDQHSIYQALNYADSITQIDHLKPEAVILDVNLPQNKSFEILKHIRQGGQKMLVIVLSIHLDQQLKEQSLQLDADHFLDKYNEFDKIPAILQYHNAQIKILG